MKNRYKKHARKKTTKIWKLIKKVIQKWSPNPSKITPKFDAEKRLEKRCSGIYHFPANPRPAQCEVVPGVIISKDFLRKKTKKKANWRVRTRWSAKSGVQKAHTERKVQIDFSNAPKRDLTYANDSFHREDSGSFRFFSVRPFCVELRPFHSVNRKLTPILYINSMISRHKECSR